MHGQVVAAHLAENSASVQVGVCLEGQVFHGPLQLDGFLQVDEGRAWLPRCLVVARKVVVRNCLAPVVVLTEVFASPQPVQSSVQVA